jgi:NTE family protein
VCAVRVRDGARVAFGRDRVASGRETDVPLGRAVAASCAIPAYYRPVEIDGDLYVDGGVHSPTNADLVAGSGVDLVVVSSPMSGVGRPGPALGLERQMRALFAAGLRRELGAVRRQGVAVVVFEPTEADQQAMGPDPMDAARRPGTARQAFSSALDHLRRADVAGQLGALSGVG